MGRKFGCEVEVMLVLHGPAFIFPTLHIAMYKKKFMPAMFIVMTNSLTHGAVVARKYILASPPVIEVYNASLQSGERFFDVPLDGVQIINLLASTIRAKRIGRIKSLTALLTRIDAKVK
jgi:hypothetical protein